MRASSDPCGSRNRRPLARRPGQAAIKRALFLAQGPNGRVSFFIYWSPPAEHPQNSPPSGDLDLDPSGWYSFFGVSSYTPQVLFFAKGGPLQ